jgi:hypothetical protein
MQRLQRRDWHGTREELAVCFHLRKGKREARCLLCNHPSRFWELRLTVGDELIESQAFSDQDKFLETVAEWRARLINAGWAELPEVETVSAKPKESE